MAVSKREITQSLLFHCFARSRKALGSSLEYKTSKEMELEFYNIKSAAFGEISSAKIRTFMEKIGR